MSKVYEIARDVEEANDLATSGFGYDTREAAEEALKDPKIDSYYRAKLKIFEVVPKEGK